MTSDSRNPLVLSALGTNNGKCSGQQIFCSADALCVGKRKPLYCLEYFKCFLKANTWYFFNSKRPLENLEKLNWTEDDLKTMMLSMELFCWQKTVSNCTVNDLDGYETIDSDQYQIYYDEDNCISRTANQHYTVMLSLKIAIISDKQGICSGVVTFHT